MPAAARIATVALLALLAGISGVACAAAPSPPGATPDTAHATSTSTLPGTVPRPTAPGEPGALIDATPTTGAPGSKAWRLTYHSRAADGRDIAVTGTLQIPDTARPAGAEPRPLISWAHPTTGTADLCAPSRKGTAELPFTPEVLGQGWATVATDYEGLGTPDPHPYLVGASEGHAVLDAARAAAQVEGSGVTLASPVVIWGFSQGGHAAAFAGQLSSTYAPELPIKGVLMAAPVSDVDHFARRAERIPSQFGVLVTVVGGLLAAYPELEVGTVFSPELQDQLGELERECIGEVNTFFDRPSPPGSTPRLVRSPSDQPAFAARLAENQAGNAPVPAPVLVVQGAKDDIVDPADTAALVGRYCAQGVPVRAVVKAEAKHGVMEPDPAVPWTVDRFAGRPPPTTC